MATGCAAYTYTGPRPVRQLDFPAAFLGNDARRGLAVVWLSQEGCVYRFLHICCPLDFILRYYIVTDDEHIFRCV